MNDTEMNVDQHILAEDLSNKINFEFTRSFLVKPLDPIMVKKEYDVPVPEDTTDKIREDKNEDEMDVVDYDKVEKEVKTVESDFKRAIVLKVPHEYKEMLTNEKMRPMDIKVGDIVIFRDGVSRWFDVLKDSQLVAIYDIIAVENNDGK